MAGITNGALAQFAKTTTISLELPPGLPRREWEQIGQTLHDIEQGVQWWLGDWWRYGEREYGDAAAQAADAGVNLGTAKNAAWVAGAIDPSRRRDDLPFGHHQAVAPLEPADQDLWLDKAAGSGMSVHELRAKIKKDANGGDSTSDTMKLLERAVSQFEKDNPTEGRADFMGLADEAWQKVHGLATPVA